MSRKRSRRSSRPSRPKEAQIEPRGAALAREAEATADRDSGVSNSLETADAERDSGVESSPLAADLDASDESELERHFFSQASETPGAPRVAPESLAPSSLTLPPEAEDEELPSDHLERESFRLHRNRLRKHVFATMGGAMAILLLGLVLNSRAESQRQQTFASDARVYAALPETEHAAQAPTLLRRAEQELDAGHGQEAAELARSALSLVPHQAEPYLLLAGALQDLGKFDEARAAFRDCVAHAESGPVASCRSFAAQ